LRGAQRRSNPANYGYELFYDSEGVPEGRDFQNPMQAKAQLGVSREEESAERHAVRGNEEDKQ
jgi:hypothetical protein